MNALVVKTKTTFLWISNIIFGGYTAYALISMYFTGIKLIEYDHGSALGYMSAGIPPLPIIYNLVEIGFVPAIVNIIVLIISIFVLAKTNK